MTFCHKVSMFQLFKQQCLMLSWLLLLAGLLFSSSLLAAEPQAQTMTLPEAVAKVESQTEKPSPQWRGNSAHLKARWQALEAEVTSQGLQLHSLAEHEQSVFQVRPVALGKKTLAKGPLTVVGQGEVAIAGDTIRLHRQGLSEIFSSSIDGIRQDFLIHQQSAGTGALTLELAIDGAVVSGQGQQVSLVTDAGRELVYNKLHVTDADGKVLSGQMLALNGNRLQISVDDTNARYPILIDPTYTDADWLALNKELQGASGAISAFAEWNGSLYIGGAFTAIGGVQANRIAGWDGDNWVALGDGFNASVSTLAVWDGKLIVGGGFTATGGQAINRIASWDGNSWSALGNGIGNNAVLALTVWDNKLIAAGSFSSGIASWDGENWAVLGGGLNSSATALAIWDGKLIVSGDFTTAGGAPALRIASWDGANWAALGSGFGNGAYTLTVWNDQLIAGGAFTTTATPELKPVSRIASWDGSSWSALADGFNGSVSVLTVWNDQLIAGGNFTASGGMAANRVARWDGTSWAALADGFNNSVSALAVWDGQLIAGGNFTFTGEGGAANRIASWDGTTWTARGSGFNNTLNALTVWDGKLIVGGHFTTTAGGVANRITSWDGTTWAALGEGFNESVTALAVWDGQLIAGGNFTASGETEVLRIASWDGTAWAALGSGFNNNVTALAVWDGQLIAGGGFTFAGETATNRIASWDGESWTALGNGFNSSVAVLAVWDDQLIAGGGFTATAAPELMPTMRIARWDGEVWAAMGSGFNGGVAALTVWDGKLIAGGGFTTTAAPGSMPANRIASWGGEAWAALGDGVNNSVAALTVYNDQLIVSGNFTTAGGAAANRIASWDSTAWSALGSGLDNNGTALTIYNNQLIVAGTFFTAGNTFSPYLARLSSGEAQVIFDSQGGSAVSSISAAAGATVTLSADPSRVGYSFGGWNSASDGSGDDYGKAGESFEMPAVDMTLYAQWAIHQYTVSFVDWNGAELKVETVNHGSDATAPTNPSREGYSFTGWTPADFSNITGALTVTAQYSINSYTIVFGSAGGSAVAPVTADYGTVITPPTNPVREGYTFVGWNPALPTTMPAENLTLIAQWNLAEYTVTASAGVGGSLSPASRSVVHNSSTSFMITPDTGYSIASVSGCGSSLNEAQTIVITGVITSACEVVATFSLNQYSVTFVDWDASVLKTETISHGSSATAPASPTREGYTFSGWDASFAVVTGDLTAQAQYSEVLVNVMVTVSGAGSATPLMQQLAPGTAASIMLTLDNADDFIAIASDCAAALSGHQVVTAALQADCAISIAIYPPVMVDAQNNTPVASNEPRRFSLGGGAGDKTLLAVQVQRSGQGSLLSEDEMTALLTLQADGSYLFSASRTGRYLLEFVDEVSGELVTVSFDVLPYLAFTSSRQPVQQQSVARVMLWLSDEPVEYPVTVSYQLQGAALEGGSQLSLHGEDNLRHRYQASATTTEPGTISLRANSLNGALLGSPAVHTLAVQQALPPLSLTTQVVQGETSGYVISTDGGLVTVTVAEFNEAELTWSWSAIGLTLSSDGNSAVFDPQAMAQGRYYINITGEDTAGRSGEYELAIRIIDSCPVASCEGAGVGGVPELVNPYAGQQNRLPLCSLVAGENRVGNCAEEALPVFVEVPNQYKVTLGVWSEEQSWNSGQFGTALNDDTLADEGYEQYGFRVNFDVLGLENPGEAVPVMIPLPTGQQIPADAVWRKFINSQWQNFVEDEANRIDSAPRDALGQCPGVSSDVWTSGLTVGHGCIRLTIEDGGPNDDDGLANGVIRDPGVLAVQQPEPEQPAEKDATLVSGGSMGGSIVLLAALAWLCRWRGQYAKMLAAITVGMLPLMVQANWYGGAQVLYLDTDVSSAKLTAKLNDAGFSGSAQVSNTSRSGLQVYAGYQLTDSIALELGYLDAGTVHSRFNGIPAGLELGQLAGIRPVSGEGPQLSLLWQFWQRGSIKPYLRGGVWRARSEYEWTDGSGTAVLKDSSNVMLLGGGASYRLNDNWQLRLGYDRYNTSNYRTSALALGAQYRF